MTVADQCSSSYFSDVTLIVTDGGCFPCRQFLEILLFDRRKGKLWVSLRCRGNSPLRGGCYAFWDKSCRTHRPQPQLCFPQWYLGTRFSDCILSTILYENYDNFCSFLGRSESRNPGFDVCLGYAQSSADLCLPEENTNKLQLVESLHAFSKVVFSVSSTYFSTYFVLNFLFPSHVNCRLERNLAHLKELWLLQSFWIQCCTALSTLTSCR